MIEEALRKALAATLYYHRIEAQAPAVARLQRAAADVFSMQAYDAVLAYWHADLAEADSQEDEDRKVAVILAAIGIALAGRLSRDQSALEPGIEEALRAALRSAGLTRYGVRGDLRSINAQRYLREHGAELVKGLNEHTLERLRTVLAEGVRNGETAERMAARITDLFDEMGSARAYKIAVTEANKAWTYAEVEQAAHMEAAGYKVVKEWLLNPLHPRWDRCDEASDVGPVPMAHLYPNGAQGPPDHPSCGCCLVTYAAPEANQPWGSMVLGQTPIYPFGSDQEK